MSKIKITAENNIQFEAEGEYLPCRGGYWSHGTNAGVFYTYLGHGRTRTGSDLGFRSAYFKKKD